MYKCGNLFCQLMSILNRAQIGIVVGNLKKKSFKPFLNRVEFDRFVRPMTVAGGLLFF